MMYTGFVLSLCLGISSIAPAMDSPIIQASPVMPANTLFDESAISNLQGPVSSSSTAPVESSPASPSPSTVSPAVSAPANLETSPVSGVDSCRDNCGFYGLCAGVAAGLVVQHNNHDALSIVYGIVGGWVLGQLVSLIACD